MSSFPSGSIMPDDQKIAVNVNGNTLNVWDDSYTSTYAQYQNQSQKAVMVWYCDWSDHPDYALALLGGSTNLGGTTIFINGWQCPYNPQWFVQTVQIEGDGLKSPSNPNLPTIPTLSYQRAKMTITFGIPNFSFGSPLDIGDDELDFSIQTYNLPSETISLQFSGSGHPVPTSQVPTFDIPIVGYNRVRYNVANLPENTIAATINGVNNAPIFGGAAGTVKFLGGRSKRKVTAAGIANWDITYSFSYNLYGWNTAYEPGVGMSTVIWAGGVNVLGSPSLYRSVNLNSLFYASAN